MCKYWDSSFIIKLYFILLLSVLVIPTLTGLSSTHRIQQWYQIQILDAISRSTFFCCVFNKIVSSINLCFHVDDGGVDIKSSNAEILGVYCDV